MLLYPLILDATTRFATKIATGTASTSPFVIFPILMAVIIVCKHWTNIKRLREGTESKFSFKKSVKAPEEKNEEITDGDDAQ